MSATLIGSTFGTVVFVVLGLLVLLFVLFALVVPAVDKLDNWQLSRRKAKDLAKANAEQREDK